MVEVRVFNRLVVDKDERALAAYAKRIGSQVDRHFFTRFGGSILTSVLSAGVAAVSNSRANSQIYIGSMSEAANLANAAKGTNTSPTIKTPQGAPVTIFVARDLDFSGVRGRK